MKQRKTLKQKLKAQVRQTNAFRKLEHEQAGITINFELQKLQPIAMGHGVMASLLTAKQVLGEDSPQFKEIQTVCQARIAQCIATLVGMGLSVHEANQLLLQGY